MISEWYDSLSSLDQGLLMTLISTVLGMFTSVIITIFFSRRLIKNGKAFEFEIITVPARKSIFTSREEYAELLKNADIQQPSFDSLCLFRNIGSENIRLSDFADGDQLHLVIYGRLLKEPYKRPFSYVVIEGHRSITSDNAMNFGFKTDYTAEKFAKQKRGTEEHEIIEPTFSYWKPKSEFAVIIHHSGGVRLFGTLLTGTAYTMKNRFWKMFSKVLLSIWLLLSGLSGLTLHFSKADSAIAVSIMIFTILMLLISSFILKAYNERLVRLIRR